MQRNGHLEVSARLKPKRPRRIARNRTVIETYSKAYETEVEIIKHCNEQQIYSCPAHLSVK